MKLNNERGVALITSFLLILSIVTLMGVIFFHSSYSERKMVEMQTNRIIAFQMAESGMDDAIVNLTNDSDYTGTGEQAISLGGGSYSTQVNTPDPANNPQIRQIVSNGYSPSNDNTQPAYQARTITSFVRVKPKAMFDNAVFAEYKIKFKDSASTDSYDSSKTEPYGPDNSGSAGDLGTNAAATSSIELIGNSIIHGDVAAGINADPAQAIQLSGDASVTGTQTASASNRALDPVTIPGGVSSSGNLTLSDGDTQSLTEGTYLFENINISGSGHLTLQGPVTIYTTGDVSIAGNGITTSADLPANFILNVSGHPDVTISGNGSLYGVIYAPEAGKNSEAVKVIDQAELFGALVAYEAEVRDSAKIHYDTSLSALGGQSKNDVALISWKES